MSGVSSIVPFSTMGRKQETRRSDAVDMEQSKEYKYQCLLSLEATTRCLLTECLLSLLVLHSRFFCKSSMRSSILSMQLTRSIMISSSCCKKGMSAHNYLHSSLREASYLSMRIRKASLPAHSMSLLHHRLLCREL